jgi:hypothetical protein
MVHAGTNGRMSDGGVLQETKFYEKLMDGSLQFPSPETIDGSLYSLPFTFVGDEAFPLLENYPQKGLSTEERIFNYRLSRARRVVENAFGIMASRFSVFHTDMALAVHNVDAVILARCVLHNYLRRKSANYSPNTWMKKILNLDNLFKYFRMSISKFENLK